MLALKGNQGTPREEVELFFSEQEARGFWGQYVVFRVRNYILSLDFCRDAIGGMLVIDTDARTTVGELLDQWEGILNQVATQYHHLEGRVF